MAVRYGTREATRSAVFHDYVSYGEPDGPIGMDYFFWVLRSSTGELIVVDSGFDADVARAMGRSVLIDPRDALAQLGIDPLNVRTVVATHLHYDHIGNLHLFPDAELLLARADFDFWTGPRERWAPFAGLVVDRELQLVADAAASGRVTFVEDELQLRTGLRLVRVGGHSPGQLSLLVDTPSGKCLLASDAVHYFEEFERRRPFALFTDLEEMRQGYVTLHGLIEQTGATLVPAHDPLVSERFPGHPAAAFAFNVESPVARVARGAELRARPPSAEPRRRGDDDG